MTGFLFPADVFNRREVDEEFRWQAQQLPSDAQIFLLEETDNPERPWKIIKQDRFNDETSLVMRGWMLTPEKYQSLEEYASSAGYALLTSASAYQSAHYLPGWYQLFADFTPASIWLNPEQSKVMENAVNSLSESAYIVKDYVKSRKHEWDTACFASSKQRLMPVINEFIRLQDADGNGIEGGIVIREFENFNKDLGEARVWWVNSSPVLTTPHPDNPEKIPVIGADFLEELSSSVKALGSPFITTDIAVLLDGSLRVVEVGDGQVSGLPVNQPAEALWDALSK